MKSVFFKSEQAKKLKTLVNESTLTIFQTFKFLGTHSNSLHDCMLHYKTTLGMHTVRTKANFANGLYNLENYQLRIPLV